MADRDPFAKTSTQRWPKIRVGHQYYALDEHAWAEVIEIESKSRYKERYTIKIMEDGRTISNYPGYMLLGNSTFSIKREA